MLVVLCGGPADGRTLEIDHPPPKELEIEIEWLERVPE